MTYVVLAYQTPVCYNLNIIRRPFRKLLRKIAIVIVGTGHKAIKWYKIEVSAARSEDGVVDGLAGDDGLSVVDIEDKDDHLMCTLCLGDGSLVTNHKCSDCKMNVIYHGTYHNITP